MDFYPYHYSKEMHSIFTILPVAYIVRAQCNHPTDSFVDGRNRRNILKLQRMQFFPQRFSLSTEIMRGLDAIFVNVQHHNSISKIRGKR